MRRSMTNNNPARSSRPVKWILGLVIAGLIVLLLVVFLLSNLSSNPSSAFAAANPIVIENRQPGSREWQLARQGFQVADDRAQQIKGYASATSVNKGQSITFHVNVNPVQTFTIDIYRRGWYNGQGGRLMQRMGPLDGVSQPTCPADLTTGMIACNWSASHAFTVPETWTSGVYLALLTNEQKYQSYILFVVRDDARQADLLYQLAVNTYQAYNNYPHDTQTGKSLYEFNSYGENTIAGTRRAVKVSFDRPYAGSGAGQLENWEGHFITWLEQSGYDVTYTSDIDVHTHGGQLTKYKGLLVVGHNEYWSRPMREAVEAARDASVNLGFFGADAVYWHVRLEPSAQGVENRIIVCYKNADIDPVSDPRLKTVLWRSPPLNQPEQSLMGIQFIAQTQGDKNVPYVVTNSSHWVYAGTDFKDGDSVANIVGYEADTLMSNHPLPASRAGTHTVLANSPFVSSNGNTAHHNAVIYQAPSGAWVFTSGTMSWAWALSRADTIDPRIQRTTANILDRFVTGSSLGDRLGSWMQQMTASIRGRFVRAPSYSDVIQTESSLVAYWRFGESSGNQASDSKGSQPGIYQGGPQLGQGGALPKDSNGAALFDGRSQYVEVPYHPTLTPSTFSVEVWAYSTEQKPDYQGVVSNRAYPAGWVIYVAKNNTWQFWINDGADMLAINGGPIMPNTWTHLVATFDGETARLYVNGKLAGSGKPKSYRPNAAEPLTIGQGQPNNNFWFAGKIDEVALYNVALTDSQVENHYNMGASQAD